MIFLIVSRGLKNFSSQSLFFLVTTESQISEVKDEVLVLGKIFSLGPGCFCVY